MVDDLELLDAWREGDRNSGSQLFDRHFGAVNRFFRNKVASGVEDLVQATFLACVESRDRFRGEASFKTYLLRIARYQLLGQLRKHRPTEALEDASVSDLGTSPSGVLARQDERGLLLMALRRIALHHQTLLELYYWEGLSGPELATVLDVSANSIRGRLHRAREALLAAVAELATSPALRESTTTNLDGWAKAVRDQFASDPSAAFP